MKSTRGEFTPYRRYVGIGPALTLFVEHEARTPNAALEIAGYFRKDRTDGNQIGFLHCRNPAYGFAAHRILQDVRDKFIPEITPTMAAVAPVGFHFNTSNISNIVAIRLWYVWLALTCSWPCNRMPSRMTS